MNQFFDSRDRRTLQGLGLLLGLLLSWLPLAIAEDTPATTEDADRKERLVFMKRQAAEYEVTLDSEQPAKLTLHNDALLRFNNPVSGLRDGILMMWKDDTRPAIFAQLFQTKDGLWIHECQSLAPAGLTMRRGPQTVWKANAGAEDFRPLTDAPQAADSAGKRLVQMKSLAQQFTGTDDFKINAGDKETTRHSLRLLNTPAYRYQAPKAGIEDGAVFAFVHGTDPEVLLVLEHRTGKETGGWYYSLSSMTCWGVSIQRNGKDVWSAPERLGTAKMGDSYYVWIYSSEVSNP